MKRALLAFLAWCAALPLVVAVAYFIVLVLAGPHAGHLPAPFEALVLAAGWLAVLILPIWAARAVWRRLGRQRNEGART